MSKLGIFWRSARACTSLVVGALLAIGAQVAMADAERQRQADSSYRQGNYETAARLYEEESRELIQKLGTRHRATLAVAGSLAASYYASGRYAKALELQEVLLKLRIEAGGERHPDTLKEMGSLGTIYGALGRTAEQLSLYEKVLRLSAEVQGERHPDTLRAMNNLAYSYAVLGRSAQSLTLIEKVLRLRTEVLGEKHPDTLHSMHFLASTYGAIGRSAEQLALIERVLRLRTEVLGVRHPDTLTSMNTLALAYGSLGRPVEQLALNEKVLQLRTEVLGERHRDTLTSMNNLALSYGERGRAAEELTLTEKVLSLTTEVLGERDRNTIWAMNNVSGVYFARGRFAESSELAEKVLRLQTEVQGEQHPETLEAMDNLARIYSAQGRIPESLSLHERALRARIEVLGARHPKTLVSMRNVAWSYARSGRYADAAALSPNFVSGAEWQRGQAGLTPELRQSVFRQYAATYRAFGMFHGKADQVVQAFDLSELGKARTLLEAMTTQHAARGGVLPPSDQDRLDGLSRQVAALDQQLAKTTNGTARVNLQASRNDLEREHQDLVRQLKSRHPKYAQLSDVKVIGAPDLPGLVPADALALSYVVTEGDAVVAFTIDERGQPRFTDLGVVRNLTDATEIFRLSLSDHRPLGQVLTDSQLRAWHLADGRFQLLDETKSGPDGARELTDVAPVARYLSERLLQPLAGQMKGKRRWIVSPDGPLARLAFDMLPFKADDSTDVATVGSRIDVQYTQSLSLYALSRGLQQQYQGLSGRKSLLAMGNAEYSPAPLNPQQRRAQLRSSPLRADGRLEDLDALWPDLPGTEAEVKAVARLFPGSADLYLGPQATEQQLQALNEQGRLTQYRYLLFSAHGFLSGERPELSSLVLGLRQRTPKADGYVTAAEWPAYDLRSDLTVLSACDTGLGKTVDGEGVMGLPFALFVAGNVNTVLTLWPVSDQATSEFVASLFTKLKAGQGATQALAATKREFQRHPRYSHPSYWAAFILVGAG